MGRYSFEKKARYRKEAVFNTGKVTKRKRTASIDLKEILASGAVDINDVSFKKDQHALLMSGNSTKSAFTAPEISTTIKMDVEPDPSVSAISPSGNSPTGNACEMYCSPGFPITTAEDLSSGRLESALRSVPSPSACSNNASSPAQSTVSSNPDSLISPSAKVFRAVRSDNFVTTRIKTSPSPVPSPGRVPVTSPVPPPTRVADFTCPEKTTRVPVPVPKICAARANVSEKPTFSHGGQSFMPIGGQPIRSFVPTDSPVEVEFNIRSTSGFTQINHPGTMEGPDVQTISKRMSEVYGGKFSERHQIVTAPEIPSEGVVNMMDRQMERNCIFEANYATNDTLSPTENKNVEDEDLDEEFQMVIKTSTFPPYKQFSFLNRFMSNTAGHNMKYKISVGPSTMDQELESICDQINRICLAHDSYYLDFKDLDLLCQKSYDQFKVTN